MQHFSCCHEDEDEQGPCAPEEGGDDVQEQDRRARSQAPLPRLAPAQDGHRRRDVSQDTRAHGGRGPGEGGRGLPQGSVVSRKVEKTLPAIHGGEIVDLTHQLALFCQEKDVGGGFPDWTLHPIFNDDDNCCYVDEPSVIDVIRSNMEVQGLEFNMEDEIDQAADMFIRRFRERMSKSI